MSRALAPLMLLLLVVLHAPPQAQALVRPLFEFFPTDLLSFTTNEPVTLLLTGLALLSLGRVGRARR